MITDNRTLTPQEIADLLLDGVLVRVDHPQQEFPC